MFDYMNSITYFANLDQQTRDDLIDIMEHSNIISLRLIDFFITTYSKKYNIGNANFNIYDEYKKQLHNHKKENFDPFRRTNRFTHQFNDGKIMNTSIGQINFMKWLHENHIIQYIHNDYNNIVNEM